MLTFTGLNFGLGDIREGDEGSSPTNIIYDTFIGLWKETRKPVTPEAIALVTGLSLLEVRAIMGRLERSGDVVWRDGGWVPADEG